jgi:Fe-Mn family superoxide dismutase
VENEYYPYINLPLPYEYDALEPFIDKRTMMIHHDKHLQTYINNLNDALKDCPMLQRLSLAQLIRKSACLPQNMQTVIRNNAGGVYNHRFFFDLLINPAEERPCGKLAAAIDCNFGSYEQFKSAFEKAALSVFGSGYAWLVLRNGRLRIVTTQNQNNPIEWGMCPILAIDVWEHAYYLKHYNVRADYIEDWTQVINWSQAECNFQTSMGCVKSISKVMQ